MWDGMTARRNSTLLTSVSMLTPVIIVTAMGGKSMFIIMMTKRLKSGMRAIVTVEEQNRVVGGVQLAAESSASGINNVVNSPHVKHTPQLQVEEENERRGSRPVF